MRPYATAEHKYLPIHDLPGLIVETASQRGVDTERLLRGTGIFRSDIKLGEGMVSPAQLLKLLQRFGKLVPGYEAPFLLGQRLFPNSSVLANAIVHSRNLEEAFRLTSLNRLQICPFFLAVPQRHGGYCHLLMQQSFGTPELLPMLIEVYGTALNRTARLLVGERVPFYFDLPFSRPRHIQEYEENLGLRLRFDQPMFKVSFEQHWLKAPLVQSNTYRKQHCLRQLSEPEIQQSLLDAITRHLWQHDEAQLPEVASALRLSPATLKRKLKQEGYAFKNLHDQVRKHKALYLLRVEGSTNEVIARQLNFTDVTNFRRAFKRWTGLTPSQLRHI